MSKQLAQFFADEFSKTPGSFKIKLEVLTFEFRPGLLFNEFVHEADSENENEISDEVEEVLEIIKK